MPNILKGGGVTHVMLKVLLAVPSVLVPSCEVGN